MATANKSKSQTLIDTAQNTKASLTTRLQSVERLMMDHRGRLAEQISDVLKPEVVIQVAMKSIRKNPELLKCDVRSLIGAIIEAGTYGWLCDGVTGHAYLVPFGDKNNESGLKEATLIPGYRGLADLVMRSGVMLAMESVHEGEEFQFVSPFSAPRHAIGRGNRFEIPLTDAYVVGQFPNGNLAAHTWSIEMIISHRDRYSKSWRNAKNKDDSPWNPRNGHAFRVMAMKTVLRDAINRGRFPMSLKAKELAAREQSLEPIAPNTEFLGASGALDYASEGVVNSTAIPSNPDEETEQPESESQSDLIDEGTRKAFESCNTLNDANQLLDTLRAKAPDAETEEAILLLHDQTRERIKAKRGERSNKK